MRRKRDGRTQKKAAACATALHRFAGIKPDTPPTDGYSAIRSACYRSYYLRRRSFLTACTPLTLRATSAALAADALESTKPLNCTVPL
ncbi:MAG: hypothetical protein JWP38_1426 [Herbaspirillum sp.]|jgi:hypothetical protein|nr:hypothetical protein [Herbaspirillum sp.]